MSSRPRRGDRLRPIDRPDVTRTAYVKPTQLTFAAHRHTQEALRVFNTMSPATDDCLELWDDEASGARSLSQDEADALAAIEQRVNDYYKRAASSLANAFGAYCAYCEVPLLTQVDVEHVVPKSEYPTLALRWDNFLAACTACNSRKRASPSRSDVDPSLPTRSPTPADYENEIRYNRYCWPDLDDTFDLISYEVEYLDPAGRRTPVTNADAVARGSRFIDESAELAEVYADLPALGLTRVPVRVKLVPDPSDIRASRTLQLCGLDRYARPGKLGDRRSMHRARAWFRAVACWHQEVPDPTHPPSALSEMFTAATAAAGFYSIWLTVAGAIDRALPSLSVMEMLQVFPGTETAHLP